MPIDRISCDLKDRIYFLTLTIKRWYYIFDRHDRWQILAESLKFFQKNYSLKIYAYVFMLNHLHLVVQCDDTPLFLRGFKGFTSRQLKKNVRETEPNILDLFIENGCYNFWQESNKPKIIENESFLRQKINYIHQNPVRKGYVEDERCWKWSSANESSEIEVFEWF